MFGELLRHSNFRCFFLALIISSTGIWFCYVGISILVYQMTGSALSIGIIIITRRLPMALFSFVGGYIADHFHKRYTMILCQIFAALSVSLIFFVQDVKDVWIIYLSGFLISLAGTIFKPCRFAAIYEIIPKNLQKTANSFFNSAESTSMIFSAALAGVLYPLYGVSFLIFINIITYLLASILIFSIFELKKTEQPRNSAEKFHQKLFSGWHHIRATSDLKTMFTYDFFSQIGFCAYFIIITLYPIKLLHMGSEGVGLFYSLYGTGSLVALIFATKLSHKNTQFYEKLRPCLVLSNGLLFILLSLTHSQIFGSILFLSAAVTYTFFFLTQENIKLVSVNKQHMGRVTAFQNSAIIIILIIFSGIYGKIGDVFSAHMIGLTSGIFLTLFPLIYEYYRKLTTPTSLLAQKEATT